MQSNYLMMDVFFEYQPGRNQEVPETLLSHFKGYLQSDGYNCYETLAVNEDITLLGSLAHCRRYFLEAEKNDPSNARFVGPLSRTGGFWGFDNNNLVECLLFISLVVIAKPINDCLSFIKFNEH